MKWKLRLMHEWNNIVETHSWRLLQKLQKITFASEFWKVQARFETPIRTNSTTMRQEKML